MEKQEENDPAMKNEFDTQIIIDHLNHKSDESQQARLLAWLLEDTAHYEEYFHMKQIWMLTNVKQHSTEKEVEIALKQFNLNIDKRNNRLKIKTFYRLSISIAAVVIIGVLSWSIHNIFTAKSEWIHYSTSVSDAVTEILLDDGTRVYLNSDTEISFRRQFISGTEPREVKIKGEAYFDVKKDIIRPFIVHTDDLRINVLGTSFNIKTGDVIETILEKGRVAIKDNKDNLMGELMPGQIARFNPRSKVMDVEKINTAIYTSWRFEQTVFEEISFIDLIKVIEERYDVSIMLQSDILGSKTYRFVLYKNESVEEVMESLKYIAQIDYSFTGGNQILIRKKR